MDDVNDETTSLEFLKKAIRQFVDERDWSKYHSPKNLAMSIGVETGELQEIFQWLSPANSRRVNKDSERGIQVQEELADVIIYSLLLAMSMDIDVSKAIINKIAKNEKKYPAKEYRGEYRRPRNNG